MNYLLKVALIRAMVKQLGMRKSMSPCGWTGAMLAKDNGRGVTQIPSQVWLA